MRGLGGGCCTRAGGRAVGSADGRPVASGYKLVVQNRGIISCTEYYIIMLHCIYIYIYAPYIYIHIYLDSIGLGIYMVYVYNHGIVYEWCSVLTWLLLFLMGVHLDTTGCTFSFMSTPESQQ